jgi:V/A-type H+-transporting ATPase subunit C
MKGKDSELDKTVVKKHLVEGGNISLDELTNIFDSKNLDEMVNRIDAHFNFGDMLENYNKSHNLIDFEVALDKFINAKYVAKLKNTALSIGTIFFFIITAENEWDDIKKIIYGKRYNIPVERISSMLIME